MRPKKLNGWMRRASIAPFQVEIWAPSEWDQQLKKLGIEDDAHAIQILGRKDDKSLKLRMWIGSNATRRFVPSEVLELVGLRISIDFRFPEH
jgi:hypothetical protein